ncbi:unconventional myosin-XIX-like isoform X2 [Acanthaster planci]|uniref:Unconventional myosin-XIX-like isoform X2 n=1 Tax=Acanthaster planci TaxID=133434 RepID=A0A8B7ZZ56_ACAPL|nr:unconventional myosin-XIX-like isoform X2 [Acanthaster planci]
MRGLIRFERGTKMAATLKAATAKIGNVLLDSKKEWRKKPRKATPQKKRPHYSKGLDVWVHDTSEVWLPATVASVGKDGSLCVKFENGKESVVKPKGDYPQVSGITQYYEETDDLTTLSPLCEASVLHCLRVRFYSGSCSTSAGVTLIAVNPFKELKGCYGEEVVQRYREGSKSNPPHVYGMAEKAYSQMKLGLDPKNQSIIVSGESGAGKTWTARCLMEYLATVAVYNPGGFEPSPGDCIKTRILDSNPILEAFGNAGTVRNHNSSRFGKYIQLQFDRGQHIIGASIQTYLLEKTRVVHQSTDERNFHIFYQLYQGASSEEKAMFGLGLPDYYLKYLPMKSNTAKKLEDCQALKTTREAMAGIGLTLTHQREIFQVLSGLLHLGNICFTSDGEHESCDIDEDNKDYQLSSEFATRLLGLDEEQLEKCLMFRKITATHSKRKSVFMRPCTVEEAGTRRDCMAKLLYARLFDWLVSFINKSTCAGQWHSFIGLLDIYGFESFQSNSLEQLCINYANEKLQQHFVAHFLRAEQEEYSIEGISWQFFRFADNQPCLDVIEGKCSIFSLMNEECCLNRHTEASAFSTRLLDSINGKHINKPPVTVRYPAFVVNHYADDVTYNTQGLIEKNKDHIPIELIELVANSTKQFVSKLVQTDLAEHEIQPVKSGKMQAKTVVSKFKTSLDSLMTILTSTTPHYIRCIKPNLACVPDIFDSGHVVSQLRACGVLETIAISAKGFPARIAYAEFQQRYQAVHNSIQAATGINKDKMAKTFCVSLMESVFGDEDKENETAGTQFGKTKVFLRSGQLEELERLRAFALMEAATCIQRCWRRYQRWHKVRRLEAATLIQAAYRGWRVRLCMEIMNDAARVIQHAMLEYCIKKQQEKELQRLELEATKKLSLEKSLAHVDDCHNADSCSSEDEEFHECRDRLSVAREHSILLSSPNHESHPNNQALQPPSVGLIDLQHPSGLALYNSGILPRRCSKCGSVTNPQPEQHGSELDDDEDADDKEVRHDEDIQTTQVGLGGTLVGIFKKPAVDFALAAVVTALLLKGPVQL